MQEANTMASSSQMNWLNVFIPNLRSATYSRCTPLARATWLNVLAYCCEQENDGEIADAANWSDRDWLQTCGVSLAEVQSSSPLITFLGGGAIVWNYPAEKQSEVQNKRKAGKRGGLAKAAGRASAGCATSTATSSANGSACSCAPTEGNRKEKGIGKKEKASASAEGVAFADFFSSLVPDTLRKESNWRENWAKIYDDLLRIDRRTKEEVKAVCIWARADNFWAGNFQSPKKLRTRDRNGVLYFDVFLGSMKPFDIPRKPQPTAAAPDPNDPPDWAAFLRKHHREVGYVPHKGSRDMLRHDFDGRSNFGEDFTQ